MNLPNVELLNMETYEWERVSLNFCFTAIKESFPTRKAQEVALMEMESKNVVIPTTRGFLRCKFEEVK